jgi:hypothetical protein
VLDLLKGERDSNIELVQLLHLLTLEDLDLLVCLQKLFVDLLFLLLLLFALLLQLHHLLLLVLGLFLKVKLVVSKRLDGLEQIHIAVGRAHLELLVVLIFAVVIVAIVIIVLVGEVALVLVLLLLLPFHLLVQDLQQEVVVGVVLGDDFIELLEDLIPLVLDLLELSLHLLEAGVVVVECGHDRRLLSLQLSHLLGKLVILWLESVQNQELEEVSDDLHVGLLQVTLEDILLQLLLSDGLVKPAHDLIDLRP